MKKDVRIRLTAAITDLTPDPGEGPYSAAQASMRACFGDGEEPDCPFFSDEPETDDANGADDEPMEMDVTGTMTLEDGQLTLSYTEPEEHGMGQTVTMLSFDAAQPAVVTMTRQGIVTSSLLFDERNRRQICSYNTGIIPVEFCIVTRRVTNGITPDGGILYLDYVIEMQGVPTERNRMALEVCDLLSGENGFDA